MAFKIVSLLGLVSVVLAIEQGNYISTSNSIENGPIYVYPRERIETSPVYKQNDHQQFAPAAYDFNYHVRDEHTGDIKSQKESRNGDAVQGRYELIDSDGYRRIVEYTADSHNGFVAIVHREPVDIKVPQPIRQDSKLRYIAPIVKDIPTQAHPVHKSVFELPKYSAAQFSPAPSPTVQTYSSEVAPIPVYRSAAHSAALQRGVDLNQDYQNPKLLSGEFIPIQQNAGNQGYILSTQNSNTEPHVKYNTIAYSVPSNNQFVNAALMYTPRVNSGSGYNQGYYVAPVSNNYYSTPVSARGLYSAPIASAVYSDHINAARNYYAQDQNRVLLDYSGYNNVVQIAQPKHQPLNRGHSAQDTRTATVLPTLDNRQNGYIVPSQQDQPPQNSDTKSNLNQGENFESGSASTTPSYKP